MNSQALIADHVSGHYGGERALHRNPPYRGSLAMNVCGIYTRWRHHELLLMANKRSSRHAARTSAYPPTTDIQNGDVRFALDFVCFAPRSGRLLRASQTSEFDPQRTFGRDGHFSQQTIIPARIGSFRHGVVTFSSARNPPRFSRLARRGICPIQPLPASSAFARRKRN